MKKNYLTFLAFLIITTVNAQLTLTKAFNAPVVGDSYTMNNYDSTTAISKVTGTNKVWDYSSVISGTAMSSNTTYTTVSSIPGASAAFPTANLASFSAPANVSTKYEMIKSNPTNEETLGTINGTAATTYSNTYINVNYPFTYGSTFTDSYGYSTGTGTNTSSENATITINGVGTGTLILPGNITLANCLQIKSTVYINSISQGFILTATVTGYSYFHASQKFVVAAFSYATLNFNGVSSTDFSFSINNAVIPLISGVKENSNNPLFNLFPNPVNDKINITMDKTLSRELLVTVSDMAGKLIKSENLNTEIKNYIDVADLEKGVYIITINANSINSRKKFIKN